MPGDEGTFANKVTKFARDNGWRIYQTQRSDRGRTPAGFPDLVMVRDRQLVFAELKAEKAARRATVAAVAARSHWLQDPSITDAQAEWLRDLGRIAAAVAECETELRLQEAMLADWEYPRLYVRVWRPSDWEDIEATLGRSA